MKIHGSSAIEHAMPMPLRLADPPRISATIQRRQVRFFIRRTLGPPKWIPRVAINYELETAVIATRSDAPIVALDLEKAAVSKSCKLTAGNALEAYWLANV